MTDSRYAVPAGVAWVFDDAADGSRIIFAVMDDLSAIVLDGSAALIWQLACEMPHSEIAAGVSEATGRLESEVAGAVEGFLRDLLHRKLLDPLQPVQAAATNTMDLPIGSCQ